MPTHKARQILNSTKPPITSVHSPKDPANEFSRKYGEYIALERALNGNTSPMLAVDFFKMLYCMDMYNHAEHKDNKSY